MCMPIVYAEWRCVTCEGLTIDITYWHITFHSTQLGHFAYFTPAERCNNSILPDMSKYPRYPVHSEHALTCAPVWVYVCACVCAMMESQRVPWHGYTRGNLRCCVYVVCARPWTVYNPIKFLQGKSIGYIFTFHVIHSFIQFTFSVHQHIWHSYSA